MIKLFEEYNEYYTVMDINEWYELTHSLETFDSKEIERIYNLVYKSNNGCCIRMSYYSDDGSLIVKNTVDNIYILKIQVFTYFTTKVIKFKIMLHKVKDEWYYVHYVINGQSSYYKCDQIDGFKKLINDKS